MAIYDRADKRIVVRIAFDGAAGSGKTTNLQQIQALFTGRRRGDLYTPEESGGRTQFFDWLEVEGGFVGGIALRFQVVSVPGQRSLWRRRVRLLQGADAIVYVCDSTPAGIEDARATLSHLRRVMAAREGESLRVVVQANKQDVAGALSPDEVRAALDLDDSAAAVGAVARAGSGVRETLVLVAREAAARVQSQLVADGIDALEGVPESPQVVYAAMRAAQLLATDGIAERRSRPVEIPVDDDEPVIEELTMPGFPHPMVPSGYIWPGGIGRAVLREIADGSPQRRDDLIGSHGGGEGSGRSDVLLFQMDSWFLKTSERRRYDDVDEAREALLRLARKKVMLGELLLGKTVLSLRPEEDGELWLWTITPLVETLRRQMIESDRASDQESLGRALASFARAATTSLALACRRGLVLDVHPGNFATVDGRTVYIDDDIDDGHELPLIGQLLLRRVVEYEHRPDAIETYLAAVEEAVASQLEPAELRELELAEALANAPARSRGERDARDRLARTIRGLAAG